MMFFSTSHFVSICISPAFSLLSSLFCVIFFCHFFAYFCSKILSPANLSLIEFIRSYSFYSFPYEPTSSCAHSNSYRMGKPTDYVIFVTLSLLHVIPNNVVFQLWMTGLTPHIVICIFIAGWFSIIVVVEHFV